MNVDLPEGYYIHQIALTNGFNYRVGSSGLHSIQYNEEGYVGYGNKGMVILVESDTVCAVELRTSVREGVPATVGETPPNDRPRIIRKGNTEKLKLPTHYEKGNK